MKLPQGLYYISANRKAVVRRRICACSVEPLLIAFVVSTLFSCAGSFFYLLHYLLISCIIRHFKMVRYTQSCRSSAILPRKTIFVTSCFTLMHIKPILTKKLFYKKEPCVQMVKIFPLTLVLLNPVITCHCKQCRSRSVGF